MIVYIRESIGNRREHAYTIRAQERAVRRHIATASGKLATEFTEASGWRVDED
jgi:hypothetical protein